MKSTPANLCVIAHFIGRGACVYCRLLSVLLMQIIKFGGKLVVNPRCSSIEHHNFKRNKAIFYVLLFNRLHRGEMHCQHFTRLHSASYSFICFTSRYSYPFVLHQEKSKIVVNLLSPQDICCQTFRRGEPFSEDIQF